MHNKLGYILGALVGIIYTKINDLYDKFHKEEPTEEQYYCYTDLSSNLRKIFAEAYKKNNLN